MSAFNPFSSRYFSCWIFVAQTLKLKQLLKFQHVNTYTRSVTSNDMSWINTKLTVGIGGLIHKPIVPSFYNKINRVSKISIEFREINYKACNEILTLPFAKMVDLEIKIVSDYGRKNGAGRSVSGHRIINPAMLLTRTLKLKRLKIETPYSTYTPSDFQGDQLEELYLSGVYPFNMTNVLKQPKLKSLTIKNISSKEFDQLICSMQQIITESTSNLPLKELCLSNCVYEEFKGHDDLWNFLRLTPDLEKIDLSNSNIDTVEFKSLCEIFPSMPKLKEVILENNLFTNSDIQANKLFRILSNAETIMLNIEYSFPLQINQELISDLKSMHRLRILKMKDVKFRIKDKSLKKEFYSCLMNLPCLEKLDVGQYTHTNNHICKHILNLCPTDTFIDLSFHELHTKMVELMHLLETLDSKKKPFESSYRFYLNRLLQKLNSRWTDNVIDMNKKINNGKTEIIEEGDPDDSDSLSDSDNDRDDDDDENIIPNTEWEEKAEENEI